MSKTATKTANANKESPIVPSPPPTRKGGGGGSLAETTSPTDTKSPTKPNSPTDTSHEKPPAGTSKPNIQNPYKHKQVKPPTETPKPNVLMDFPPHSAPRFPPVSPPYPDMSPNPYSPASLTVPKGKYPPRDTDVDETKPPSSNECRSSSGGDDAFAFGLDPATGV